MTLLLVDQYAGSRALGVVFRPSCLTGGWVRMGHWVEVVADDLTLVRSLEPDWVSSAGDPLWRPDHAAWLVIAIDGSTRGTRAYELAARGLTDCAAILYRGSSEAQAIRSAWLPVPESCAEPFGLRTRAHDPRPRADTDEPTGQSRKAVKSLRAVDQTGELAATQSISFAQRRYNRIYRGS